MSGLYSEISATRIRGELDPSPELKAAINRYLKTPANEHAIKLHTTSQVLVNPESYYGNEYHNLLKFIGRTLRPMARTAFVLAEPTLLRQNNDGSGRLYLSVQNREQLEEMAEELERLPGQHEDSFLPHMLCFEVAQGGLSRNVRQLARAQADMTAALSQPDTQRTMTASGLRLVTRDLPYGPLPARSLAGDE